MRRHARSECLGSRRLRRWFSRGPGTRPHADPGGAAEHRRRARRRPRRAHDGDAAPAPRPRREQGDLVHSGLRHAAAVRALARVDPHRPVHAQPRGQRERAPLERLRPLPPARGRDARDLAQVRRLPHGARREVHERLRVGRGRGLHPAGLGRVVRPPVGAGRRPLLELLGQRQPGRLPTRQQGRGLQCRRGGPAGGPVHPRLREPARAYLPLRSAGGPAHPGELRGALRGRSSATRSRHGRHPSTRATCATSRPGSGRSST